MKKGIYSLFFKRFFDILASGFLLMILSPLLVFFYILIRLKLGSPVFFRQERPGKDEKVFRIFKFRSMNDAKDENGNLLCDEMRITPLGNLIRKFSIDELPQFINIFKGDMSFIGPRPLLVRYLPYYNQRERLRHSVRPGVTGLSQVKGRSNLSWDEKFELDVKYVENITFLGDIKIALLTVLKVFLAKDVVLGSNPFFDLERMAKLENKSSLEK